MYVLLRVHLPSATACADAGKSVSFESEDEAAERAAVEAEAEAEAAAEAEMEAIEAARPSWARWSLDAWVATMDVPRAISGGIQDLLLNGAAAASIAASSIDHTTSFDPSDQNQLEALWYLAQHILMKPYFFPRSHTHPHPY